MGIGRELVRHPLNDGNALLGKHAYLVRIVCHQPDGCVAEILEYLRGNSKPPLLRLETQPLIGIDRVEALVLQFIGLQLVDQPDAR